MKKIIFLLLLAQTISLLYADEGCRAYTWRWGIKSIEHVDCYHNCKQHPKAHGKCIQCGHVNIPKDMKVTAPAA